LFKSSHCQKCVPNCVTAELGTAQKKSSKLGQNYHCKKCGFQNRYPNSGYFSKQHTCHKNYTNFKRLDVPLLAICTSAARERAQSNWCVPFSRKVGIPLAYSIAWNTSPLKLFVTVRHTDRQTDRQVWTELPPISPVSWNKSIPSHNDVKTPQGLLHKLTSDKMLRAGVSFVISALGHFITRRYLILEQTDALMGEILSPRNLKIIGLRSEERSVRHGEWLCVQ